MPSQQSNIKERNRTDLREPGKYKVVFHNDDFTPMEFVTLILVNIFFKSYEEAEQLMLTVHHSGKAVVGTYPYDIAMSKTYNATSIAREQGYPLRITVEQA